MLGGNSTPSPGSRSAPGTDEAFRKLLLRIAAQAAERPDSAALIQFFCRTAREFFQVSGVYFWRRHAGDELVAEQAEEAAKRPRREKLKKEKPKEEKTVRAAKGGGKK